MANMNVSPNAAVSVQVVATVLGYECNIIINADTGAEARELLKEFSNPESIKPTHDESGNRTVSSEKINQAAKKKEDDEAAQKKAEEEAALKKAEEEAALKKAEEEAALKKAEEEAALKKAEEEAAPAPYTADDARRFGKALLDSGRKDDFKALLALFGVDSITVASAEQVDPIARALEAMTQGKTPDEAYAVVAGPAEDDSGNML